MVALAAPLVIPRDPAPPPAQDFDLLKREAIALLQSLCGHWTDYNAHDPGVTLIELLSYALTDLGYRAALPPQDLLASTDSGAEAGFYPAWQALPSSPVTIADFRRLLLDRIEGLGNLWLSPQLASGDVTGLYDLRIHAALPLPGVHPKEHPRYRRLVDRVRRVFERHRPLCEDIGAIRVLQPVRTVISAQVKLARNADPETVMAEALFRLGLALAPEPRRTGLPPSLDATLFDGPLPINGWIPPGELTDKPEVIEPDRLAEILADVPGVLHVSDLGLWVEGAGVCHGAYRIGADRYCSLDAGLESDTPALEFSSNGRRCQVDRGEVLRRLMRRWEAHRARPRLTAAYRHGFAVPAGTARDLARFAPLGPQLPRVYGLGNPDRPRDAAAAQLKGYLSIFEAVMRGLCARLQDVQALIGGTVPAGLPPRQHEGLLDFLLALYGTPVGVIPMPSSLVERRDAAARHRIRVKQALLDNRAALARRRGRGFDPQARSLRGRLAGAELHARLLLGAGRGRRSQLCFIEHMMLRPRTRARREAELGRYRYGMAVSAVVSLPETALNDHDYRGEIEAAIRAELPAHIGLDVHFVRANRWRRLHDLHRLWRAALDLDEHHAADQLAVDLRNTLERWTRRDEARR